MLHLLKWGLFSFTFFRENIIYIKDISLILDVSVTSLLNDAVIVDFMPLFSNSLSN